jgi:hypothetical protein
LRIILTSQKEFFTKKIYYELLQDKVTAALAKDIPAEDDMVWATAYSR